MDESQLGLYLINFLFKKFEHSDQTKFKSKNSNLKTIWFKWPNPKSTQILVQPTDVYKFLGSNQLINNNFSLDYFW